MYTPAAVEAFRSGALEQATNQALELLESCALCPRECRVDRLAGQEGSCRTARQARMDSAGPHFGEEPPLVGIRGSGTIFFSGCNLGCVFCQNYTISTAAHGRRVSSKEIAATMLALQRMGVHNINLVTPTHCLAQILEALMVAIPLGLGSFLGGQIGPRLSGRVSSRILKLAFALLASSLGLLLVVRAIQALRAI